MTTDQIDKMIEDWRYNVAMPTDKPPTPEELRLLWSMAAEAERKRCQDLAAMALGLLQCGNADDDGSFPMAFMEEIADQLSEILEPTPAAAIRNRKEQP